MKHGKRPTVRQKKFLKSMRRNPDNWLVVKDNNEQMVIVHRDTGKVQTIYKQNAGT